MTNQEQVTPGTHGQRLLNVFASILLVLAGFFSGAILGGLFIKLFVPRAAMGWDGIADALGGLMLGGLTGVVASIILAGVLTVKRRFQMSAILIVLVLIVIAWGVITHESKTSPAQVPREQTVQPGS